MSTENHSTNLHEKSWPWISMVLLVSLGWRITWACILSTIFVPDEYYQTVEPSFNFINRYDTSFHRVNTWEWQEGYEIRSYVPLIPYLLFHALERLLRHHIMILSNFLALGPRVVQGCIAAIGDTLLFTIVHQVSWKDGRNGTKHHRIATLVWMIHMLSWSGMYCMSRTLINSLETVLLVIAVYFAMDTSEDHHHHHHSGSIVHPISSSSLLLPKVVPSPSSPSRIPTSIILPCVAALTVHSRPTSLLFLAPLLILKLSAHKQPVHAFFLRYLPSGISVLMACVVFDTWCYSSYRQATMTIPASIPSSSSSSSLSSPPQEHHHLPSIVTFTAYFLPNLTAFITSITAMLVITPYNFFYINVYRNYATLFYGSQPWHWAYSQGLPVMLGLYLPPVLYGLVYTSQPRVFIMFQALAIVSIVLQSLLTSHQEFRFLLPTMPFFHILVGYVCSDLIEYGERIAPRITKRLLLLHPLGVFLRSADVQSTPNGELRTGEGKTSGAMNDHDDDDAVGEGTGGQVSPLLISPLACPYAFGVDDDDDDRHYHESKANLATLSLTGLLSDSGKGLTGTLIRSGSHGAVSSSSSLLEKTVEHIEQTIDKTLKGTWMDYFQMATSPLSSTRSQKAEPGMLTRSGKDLTVDLTEHLIDLGEDLTGHSMDSSKDLTESGKYLTGNLTGRSTDSPRPRTAPRSSHSGRSFTTTSTASSSGWLDQNNRSSYFLRSFDSHVSSEAAAASRRQLVIVNALLRGENELAAAAAAAAAASQDNDGGAIWVNFDRITWWRMLTAWATDLPIVSFLTDPQSFQSVTVPSTVSTLALALKATDDPQETTNVGGSDSPSHSKNSTVNGRVITPTTTPGPGPGPPPAAASTTATITTSTNPSPVLTTNSLPSISSSRHVLDLICSAAPFFYLFFLVPLLHLTAVGYLSTRHQRGGETAFAFLAQHLRSIGQHQGQGPMRKMNHAQSLLCRYMFDWHSPSCPFAPPLTSVRPSVAVLLLAPCHAFPGTSWLASTERMGGYDLRVYAPDCSPKERKEVSSTTASPPLPVLPPLSSTLPSPPIENPLTESAQFDQSPALFLRSPSGGPLSAKWSRYTPTHDTPAHDIPLHKTPSHDTPLSIMWSSLGGRAAANSHTQTHTHAFVLTFDAYLPQLEQELHHKVFEHMASFPHADVRYDYDDPRTKRTVVLMKQK